MEGAENDAGLAGKVAILSGGGAAGDGIGNGRAAAILLARAGTKVLVADRDLKLAERTVEMIQAEAALRRHSPATSPARPNAGNWSRPPSTAGAGSTSSTIMSASAAAAAWSTRGPSNIGG
jgi:NAD(P)-dependent dehydrogenase (short-subunit alcohol dehydrogenase family)